MNSRPDNADGPTIRKEKQRAVASAFMQYQSSTGPFADWRAQQEEYEDIFQASMYPLSNVH